MYTTCGHPIWNQTACGRCDSCRDGREWVRRSLAAAQSAGAAFENDPNTLKLRMRDLQRALDRLPAERPTT